MNHQKILVFFGAHPDDETFGIGATLALYVIKGVKVYCVCSTRGEVGTVDPKFMQGYATIADLRSHELKCAGEVIGLTDIFFLDYRDSGMPGSEHNKHPDSLAMAPIEEVAGKMVKIIRELKPDVVITHDDSRGYRHPDHIATHNAVIKAFYAASDPTKYPQAGPPYQPNKLYFSVRPRRVTKLMIKLMPLFGQDPHHFGRNRDIDLTKSSDVEHPVHAVVMLPRQARQIRVKAAACHASQGGLAQPRRGPFLFRLVQMFRRPQDNYMRQYPPPTKHKEKDLFEGLL